MSKQTIKSQDTFFKKRVIHSLWEAQDHANNDCHTPNLKGSIIVFYIDLLYLHRSTRHTGFLITSFCCNQQEEGHLSYKCPKNLLGEREPPPKKKKKRKHEDDKHGDRYKTLSVFCLMFIFTIWIYDRTPMASTCSLVVSFC